MPILALMLYGSYARGDVSQDSDIDILAVEDTGPIARREAGRTILSTYPLSAILKMSSTGSLFVWHLISEGIEIYDTSGVFSSIRAQFVLRSDYSPERKIAADVGWALLSQGAPTGTTSAVKALLYSVRTIAISHLAERGIPAFSKGDVLRLFPDRDLDSIWADKYCLSVSSDTKAALERYLARHAGPPPRWASGSFEDALNDRSLSMLVTRKMLAMLAESGVTVDYSFGHGFTLH